MNEPVGIVGWAPLRSPALFAGLCSAAAGALASCVPSGLASCGSALGAAGRIAPALVVVTALPVPDRAGPALPPLLGAGAFGAAAAVCVDFVVGADFFFCAAAGSAAGSEPFNPTNRDMRSNTPSDELGCSWLFGVFDVNRPPNQLPDEPESPADATRVVEAD